MKSRFHFVVPSVLFGILACSHGIQAAEISEKVIADIGSLLSEKEARTPEEQKLDSHLVFALKRSKNVPISNSIAALGAKSFDMADDRVTIEIRAAVDDELLARLNALQAQVLSSSQWAGLVKVNVSSARIPAIAKDPKVKFVRPAVKPILNDMNTNGITSLWVDGTGDVAHGGTIARKKYKPDLSQIKIGVISDSIDNSAKDLDAAVKANVINRSHLTVLKDQQGEGEGEGLAMLELVNTIAPGAQLFFATGFSGVGGMADNIRELGKLKCDIIIDDVSYFNESPFQDGPIARAVNEVVKGGAMYFSSAANSGNKVNGTSGTWQGDFKDGGAAPNFIVNFNNGKKGHIHAFAPGKTHNIIEDEDGSVLDLFWADPLEQSTNDYDLFLLDPTGTQVLDASTNVQTVEHPHDPYEWIPLRDNNGNYIYPKNCIVVIVKSNAAAERFLYLDTQRATLSIGTDGNTRGHNAVETGLCVAASKAPQSRAFSDDDQVESFSSDGPRRIFFESDGTPITPGNFSSTGGRLLAKPDFTAADGVDTTLTPLGLKHFYGTSAAAPHAGAIAALLKAINPKLTNAEIISAMKKTAIHPKVNGDPTDTGAGILRADLAADLIAPK